MLKELTMALFVSVMKGFASRTCCIIHAHSLTGGPNRPLGGRVALTTLGVLWCEMF